jgi:hypothetical protein
MDDPVSPRSGVLPDPVEVGPAPLRVELGDRGVVVGGPANQAREALGDQGDGVGRQPDVPGTAVSGARVRTVFTTAAAMSSGWTAGRTT